MAFAVDEVYMDSPKIVHHRAGEGVTGSCHQFWLDKDKSVLIDCANFKVKNSIAPGTAWRWIFPSRESRH